MPQGSVADTEPLFDLIDTRELADALFTLIPLHDKPSALPEILSEPPVIDDLTLWRLLLPINTQQETDTSRLFTQFALSFVLRHHTTMLALAAHRLVACIPQLPRYLDRLTAPLAAFLQTHSQFAQLRATGHVPLFGFSALGLHLRIVKTGFCRAFDRYDLAGCPNPGIPCFCREHQSEAWWKAPSQGTTQAQMFAFHAIKGNIHRYDEDSLQRLLDDFWNTYRSRIAPPQPPNPKAALYFGYQSLADVSDRGRDELRKRYLHRVKSEHPDHGGNRRDFERSREQYGSLLQWLESRS